MGHRCAGLANVETLCSEGQKDPDLSVRVEPPCLHLPVLPGDLECWKL